jgi:hypothetical protein
MKNILFLILMSVTLFSCSPKMEESVDIGPAPTVDFKIDRTSDPNHVIITNTSTGIFQHKFDFGNGDKDTLPKDSYNTYYPFAGNYQVSLTGSGKGGTITTTKTLNIPSNDPKICTDVNAIKLSGGCDSIEGYTWVMSRDSFGTGVGPVQPYVQGDDKSNMAYYHVKKDSAAACQYNVEITFKLRGGVFINNNHGQSMYAWDYANAERSPNPPRAQYKDICLDYTPPANTTWKIVNKGGALLLQLTNNEFILYKQGKSEYEICYLDQNSLILRNFDQPYGVTGPAYNYRYFKLIRKKKT